MEGSKQWCTIVKKERNKQNKTKQTLKKTSTQLHALGNFKKGIRVG